MTSSTWEYSVRRRTLEDLQRGADTSGSDPSHLDVIPAWLDRERFTRGQLFFQHHLTAMTFSFHLSLVCGFSVPNLASVLYVTKQSDTPEKSLKRYLRTFYNLLLWHTGDVWNVGSRAHRSLRDVRLMHVRAANVMSRGDPGKVHVSQYDMSLVLCGFMGSSLLYPDQLGIPCCMEELEDYLYFWKCIGYLLGIEDKYNLCASAEYESTLMLVRQIEKQVLLPNMRSLTPVCQGLTDAYCQGVNLFLGFNMFTREAMYALAYDLANQAIPKLSWKDWFRYQSYKLFLRLIKRWTWLNYKLNDYVVQNFYLFEERALESLEVTADTS